MGKILSFIGVFVFITLLAITPINVSAQSGKSGVFSFFDTLVSSVADIFSLSVESQVRQAIELKEERKAQLEALPPGSKQQQLFKERLEAAEAKLANIIEKSKNPAEKAKILKQIQDIEAKLQKKKQQAVAQDTIEKNVFNLVANYDVNNRRVNLTWQNPNLTEAFEVKVVRRNDSVSADLNSDPVIYSGTGQSLADTDLISEATYFYSVFVVAGNEASSGAVVSLTLPVIEGVATEEEIPTDDPESEQEVMAGVAVEEVTENFTETVNRNDPFFSLREAGSVDPAILAITHTNFKLIQTGETEQTLRGSGILIKDDKDLIMRFDPTGSLASLKTIGVSVKNSSDEQVFSFLLKPQVGDTYYLARIVSLGEVGTYPITIYLINNQDEVMKKISSELIVSLGVGFNQLVPTLFSRALSMTFSALFGGF